MIHGISTKKYQEYIGRLWGMGVLLYIPVFVGYGCLCTNVTQYIYQNKIIGNLKWLSPPLNVIDQVFSACVIACFKNFVLVDYNTKNRN